MMKILFICHGNICRSPAAEMVMRGLTDRAEVASAAVSSEEEGNPIYPPMLQALKRQGISVHPHFARRMQATEYRHYDHIVCMDRWNLSSLRRLCNGDPEGKISLLLSWAGEDRDVADPWYTRDFDSALADIERGCRAMVKTLDL